MVKKERIGIVVSNKSQKTIVVAVQTRYAHPKYGKILVKTKRYMAHDEENLCNCGDVVLLEEVKKGLLLPEKIIRTGMASGFIIILINQMMIDTKRISGQKF